MEILENEIKLIDLVQKDHNEAALTALYRFYLPIIYGFCVNKLGNKEEAEEITSEVFLQMVRQIKNFKGEASFKNWLFAIAKNLLADKWRKSYNLKTVSLEEFMEFSNAHEFSANLTSGDRNDDGDMADNNLEQTEDAAYHQEMDKLKTMVGGLPEKYRRVLELRFFERMSLGETAREMGIEANYVKVLQYRAIKKASEISNHKDDS